MSAPGRPPTGAGEARDTSLSELRHNLRTPINHILGYGEMLAEEAEARGLTGVGELLGEIQAAGRQALAAIDRGLGPAASFGEAERAALRQALLEPAGRVTDACDLLQHSCGAAFGPDLGRIRTAAERLQSMADGLGPSGTAPTVSPDTAPAAPVSPPQATEPVAGATPSPAAPVARPAAPPAAGGVRPDAGRLLVVDDDAGNRDLLARRLGLEGYTVALAEGGRQALQMLREAPCDLLLLDILMPEVDGYQVLAAVKADPQLRDLPVIVISALDDIASVVRGLQMGADDYLAKPFDPVLLRVRVGAAVERKRLRDEERRQAVELKRALAEAEAQRHIAETLLLNILPAQVAQELRDKGEVDPKYFEDVTILFTDFVGFTRGSERLAAEELVRVLHDYFAAFDRIVARYGLEKLKTIGDSYMLAGGLPVRSPSHPVDVVLAALEMVHATAGISIPGGIEPWQLRVGAHTGPVIAGVVGTTKFAFDIWGDTVNSASRMESSGAPGRVNISERTYARVKDFFECEHRGRILTKDKREVDMYFINGVLPKLLDPAGTVPPPAFRRRYRIYFDRELPAFPTFLLTPGEAGPEELADRAH